MKYANQALIFLLGILIILFSRSAIASDYHLIDLDELSVDYKNYAWVNDKARDPVIYPEHPKEGVSLNMNTDILSYFGWDSIVHSTTTGSQYRAIGLETRLYLRPTSNIEVGYFHHSQHLLDRSTSSMDKFPVEDAVEIKFYIFRARPGRESLF